jgi:hypothetical protein
MEYKKTNYPDSNEYGSTGVKYISHFKGLFCLKKQQIDELCKKHYSSKESIYLKHHDILLKEAANVAAPFNNFLHRIEYTSGNYINIKFIYIDFSFLPFLETA